MTGATHIAARAVTQIPQYCQSAVWHKPLTTAQWETCWKAGWNEPTTTAAKAGYAFGHTALPILLAVLLVCVLIAAARRGRSRRPATSN